MFSVQYHCGDCINIRCIHAKHMAGYLPVNDFGSDIGSLSSLPGLDVDFLKIDGAYTRDLGARSFNHEIVTAITRLSRTIGFKVIAEQVEEEADFDELRALGVDFIQGNYVEQPRPLGQPAAQITA